MSSQKLRSEIFKSFDLSLNGMRKIIKDFHSEMSRGLAGEESSLKMIPAYVDRPTGEETGQFMALDLGGTNFRILKLELIGNGRFRISKARKFTLDERCLAGTAGELFAFLADRIKGFIKDDRIGWENKVEIGFTFSFPVEQTAVASGTLLRWTKGFKARGVIGKDVVELLNEALSKREVGNIEISALANDTVGTLMARSYEDHACDIGVIIGTGTNACYSERLSDIPKWRGPKREGERMIVNTEWGNFNKLALTKYDRALNRSSSNPGQQILEKMVSGMYLGELTRFVLMDLMKKRGPLGKKYSFKTEYMSRIEGDDSKRLSATGYILKKAGMAATTLGDRMTVKKICGLVSSRGARISAAAMAALITKIDPDLSGDHTIAIDGSLYERHPTFSKNIKTAFIEIFGKKASRIKMSLTKDGSGKGAAIIAAVASK